MYDEQPQLSYPSRKRGSRYPLALGSTATTTTHRPYDDINEISSEGTYFEYYMSTRKYYSDNRIF